ncbi:MAG: 50S ribosomal protein L32 [Armatimonadota bacterium]
MPNPKSKFSNARRDKRRSNWLKIDAPTLVRCGNCDALHMPHHVCPSCGTYGSDHRQVVNVRRGRTA